MPKKYPTEQRDRALRMALKSQVRDLTEANEILKAASIFFAGELDPRRR